MMRQPDNDKSPCLTGIASDTKLDDLPILTEIIIDAPAPRALGAEDIQLLLQPLEAHLKNVFTSKLNSQLEQLQKLAVDLAVSEFKAELPQLLRDALIKTDLPR